jgi:hypothetical protein
VVDCTGRRSPLATWLAAVGAKPPADERADSGGVYYCRQFQGERLPEARSHLRQSYDSMTILTLPSDRDAATGAHTWAVVFAVNSRDRDLRALREPAAWQAALACYPHVAHWGDPAAGAAPITGIQALAGLEDRHRSLVVDGQPVATGVVPLGDAWGCTGPDLGRGASMALLHGQVLRDVLREVDAGDPDKLARRFADVTAAVLEPLYRATVIADQQRLAQLDADADGRPFRLNDPGWLGGQALTAAALTDADLARDFVAIGQLIEGPADVFGRPGTMERTMALGGGAPPYPLGGPSRAELLAAIAGA